jgi:hypothetical protein
MTSDIGILARTAYETGIDPITYATEHIIRAHVESRDGYREVGMGLPASAVACMIIAGLMDAGWSPPEVTG